MLSEEDWQILEHIHEFLDPLASTTLSLEGASSTLDQVLPAMDFILYHYEEYKARY